MSRNLRRGGSPRGMCTRCWRSLGLRRRLTNKGSGHFRAKIYSKPEASVIRQHTAKKQAIFHTELHASWSMKALKIDMARSPRQWRRLTRLRLLVWRGSWKPKDTPSGLQTSSFPLQGLHRLGYYDLYQNQQLVEKPVRFLCRALKSQTLCLSV